MAELIRNARIDPRQNSYKDFFDKKWFVEISDVVAHTKLEYAVFDLARAWLGASHVHAMPWVFATSITGMLRDNVRHHEPPSIAQIKGLRENILGKLDAKGVTVRPWLHKVLSECLLDLGAEADDALDAARATVLKEPLDVWKAYLDRSEFATILWSGERMCYGSLYYHYEWFLTECMRIKKGDESYRIGRHDDFKEEFEFEFGHELQRLCWSAQRIVVARTARHALVHNGGRVAGKLERQLPKEMHHEGELQIMAEHTTSLYSLLKETTMALATRSVTLKEFQHGKE